MLISTFKASIADFNDIAPYLQQDVLRAYALNIASSNNEGYFMPEDYLTYKDMVSFSVKLSDISKRIKNSGNPVTPKYSKEALAVVCTYHAPIFSPNKDKYCIINKNDKTVFQDFTPLNDLDFYDNELSEKERSKFMTSATPYYMPLKKYMFIEGVLPKAVIEVVNGKASYYQVYLNKTGKLAINGKYHRISAFQNGYAEVSFISSDPESKRMIIDSKGKITCTLTAVRLQSPHERVSGPFNDGLAYTDADFPEHKASKYTNRRFINPKGQYLPQAFSDIHSFSEGLAFASVNEMSSKGTLITTYGFINPKGQWVIKMKSTDSNRYSYSHDDFSNGLCLYRRYDNQNTQNTNLFFMNKEGKTVIDVSKVLSTNANSVKEAMSEFCVSKSVKDGKIAAEGSDFWEVVKHLKERIDDNEVSLAVDRVSPFFEGVALVQAEYTSRRNFREDKKAVEIAIKLGTDDIYGLTDNKICFFIDKDGKVVSDYFIARSYWNSIKDGLALFDIGGKKQFVNRSGKVVLDVSQYKGVDYFCEGLVAARKGEKWGYIDKSGNVVIDFKYDAAFDFSSDIN